jgi:hypothetical protein
VVVVAGGDQLTVGSDHVNGDEVVAGEAELGREPSVATPERKPPNARSRYPSAGGGETESLGLVVELAPQHPAVSPRGPADGVDADTFHEREIDEDAVVAHALAGDAMTTAPDRDGQPRVASEPHGGDDVGCAPRSENESGLLIDHRVPDPPMLVVGRLTWPDDLAVEVSGKIVKARHFCCRSHGCLSPSVPSIDHGGCGAAEHGWNYLWRRWFRAKLGYAIGGRRSEVARSPGTLVSGVGS